MKLCDFINRGFTYAVVGATTNHDKYGYRVLKDLQSAGYRVWGVNPKYSDIEGVTCCPSLKDLPQIPDVVVFVVPPAVGLQLLPDAVALGMTKVWFQPGAESPEIRARAQELGLEAKADGSCIMVARSSLGV